MKSFSSASLEATGKAKKKSSFCEQKEAKKLCQ